MNSIRRYLIDKNLISHIKFILNNKLSWMPEEEKKIEANLIRKNKI